MTSEVTTGVRDIKPRTTGMGRKYYGTSVTSDVSYPKRCHRVAGGGGLGVAGYLEKHTCQSKNSSPLYLHDASVRGI